MNKTSSAKTALAAIVGAALLATAAPETSTAAHAESSQDTAVMMQDCAVNFCFYDAHGQRIALASRYLKRLGLVFQVEANSNGFVHGVDFYYTDAACTTPPDGLFWTGNVLSGTTIDEDLPYYAPFDGKQLWGPVGPAQIVTPKSFRYVDYGVAPGTCSALNNPSPIAAHAAKVIDSTTYYLPFSVR